MKKLKVMTVVGTRPEIIRLSRVIARLDEHVDHVLVHTGQNYDYELNQIFFDELGLRKPDHFLDSVGATTAETIGNVIARVDPVLEREVPDALLVLGDTNSCLAVIAATFLSFTWKPAIAASTRESRKRPIAALSITPRTSTCRTATLRGNISCVRVFRPIGW
jgi:UDP-N-acetylglucosamine 2-epimerase